MANIWLKVKSTANFVGITTKSVLKNPKQMAQPTQMPNPYTLCTHRL